MKRCPFCAEEIQDAAVKCRFCGEKLDAAAPAPAARDAAGVVATAHPGGDTPATPVFGGSPSWRARFWSYAATFVLAAIGVSLAVALPMVAHTAWPITGGVAGGTVAVAFVWWLWLTLTRRNLHYRITTRTIDIESGVLSKRIETLQLWKVRDIEFDQSLIDRMLGVGHIYILTHDAANPKLTLWGLPQSREIFDKLKDAIELSRQSRNVVGLMQ